MGLLVSGKNPASLKTAERSYFTATAGQTTFTVPGGYSVGDLDVYMNGIKLVEGDDYFATNGTTVVLTSGANLGDSISTVTYYQFQSAAHYTKAESDSRYLTATATTPLTGFLRAPNYGVSSTSDSNSTELTAAAVGQQGVGVKAYGRSMATFGGDLHMIADNRGAGGGHRMYSWNGTSLSTVMSIDSSGRMTKPLQPAFQAYNPLGQYITGSTEAAFNSTYLNIGNCYNTSNGRFTAPIAGRYFFHFDGLFDNISAGHHISLRKNGVQIDGSEGYSDGVNECIVKAMVYNLNAGEYVSLFVDTASSRIHQRYGSFCGYLVS